MSFLTEAVAAAARSQKERMERVDVNALKLAAERVGPVPSFRSAVSRGGNGIRIIAEIKRESPSAGPIRPGARARDTALEYLKGGADAISVVTSDYLFGGSISDIEAVRDAGLPVLRKDFIVDSYGVLEARACGASAVLLITEALSEAELARLLAFSHELEMDALIESHGRDGLEKALAVGAQIIGINNRNLETLEVDVETTGRMLAHIPSECVVVSESGIRTASDVRRMEELGVDALLIGEALMRHENPGAKLKEFKRD